MSPHYQGIHLFSGGLDSVLSAKILLNQGIAMLGVYFILPFYAEDYDPSETSLARQAAQIGLPLRFVRCGDDYITMLKNPPHGYGKNMNPCIDCHIFFIQKSAQIMQEENAAFISTGEVIGQRPMSQMKKMLLHIENTTNLRGRILRPLSAQLLTPTIAENEGIVDRSKLLDIQGRGRKRQMELAEIFHIKDYASPAGGCLFTEPHYSQRLKDLLTHQTECSQIDIYLLTVGRHFRLREEVTCIVSRREDETNRLLELKEKADAFLIPDFTGPVLFIRGNITEKDYPILASLLTRYGKYDENKTNTYITLYQGATTTRIPATPPISEEQLEKMRI